MAYVAPVTSLSVLDAVPLADADVAVQRSDSDVADVGRTWTHGEIEVALNGQAPPLPPPPLFWRVLSLLRDKEPCFACEFETERPFDAHVWEHTCTYWASYVADVGITWTHRRWIEVALACFAPLQPQICGICLDYFEPGEQVTAMPCYAFGCPSVWHADCIGEWLSCRRSHEMSCPLCRAIVGRDN